MDCDRVPRAEMAEKYLLGRLSRPERDQYESHYFECARCFEELESMCLLREGLRRAAPAVVVEPVRQVRFGWLAVWRWAPAFALLLVSANLGWWWMNASRKSPVRGVAQSNRIDPVPDFAALAAVQPPPYVRAVWRGSVGTAARHFREAMEHYVRGDYKAAIDGLRPAAAIRPRDAGAAFFLGACYLLTGQPDEALRQLRHTVSLGETPYLAEAHFYLAKVYLQKRDARSARAELEQAAAHTGRMQTEARRLLELLPEAR